MVRTDGGTTICESDNAPDDGPAELPLSSPAYVTTLGLYDTMISLNIPLRHNFREYNLLWYLPCLQRVSTLLLLHHRHTESRLL